MVTDELIMELTDEQGTTRKSQVQPPSRVWEQFFGIRLNSGVRPAFRLQNMKVSSNPEQYKVVKHHHNWTIEIGDAKGSRPAILRIRKSGQNAFEYWVYRPPSKAYTHCDWLLSNLAAPKPKERRWVIISR